MKLSPRLFGGIFVLQVTAPFCLAMPIILFDTTQRHLLRPFTAIRAIADLRAGIFTGKERWEKLTGQEVFVLTVPYLQPLYQSLPDAENTLVDASVIADEHLVEQVMNLKVNEAIISDDAVIAAVIAAGEVQAVDYLMPEYFKKRFTVQQPVKKIVYPWHIFQLNDELLRSDFALITANRLLQPAPNMIGWTAPENIFIEDGAVISHCFINASEGPVYLGKNSVIMEGCLIRGPFAMGEGSVLKMGTRIYGATTLGPGCTVGGEVKNCVLMGYSSKAHDGYLGDSVIGEWCNLGGGTSNSNVRNDAGIVKMDIGYGTRLEVGLKCGLLLGDYSRSAINTSFNTGTFAGIACNIFGEGFVPKLLPDFSWGFSQRYIFEKAIEHIDNWKRLKQKELTPAEVNILEHLYKQTTI